MCSKYDDAGHTITNSDEVVAEFIAFYEQLLGGTRNSRTRDLTQYRPWASRILSHEDGVKLTRPVSVEEIKLAFFDIAKDKSPGPDGYTTTFYKTAWPVVGDEITRAIMDFFTNGRLLKQCNVYERYLMTLLAYHKMHSLSEERLVILYCSLSSYSRAIAKVFIQWVEECVTTPTFSVCNNGSAYGFFKGARGLRLGDPMPPYLFVLVMEVLPQVQLIKSVLMVLNTYWAMAFILPKDIIKDIEKRLRNFLWKGVARTGYLKVAWSQVCNPVDERGLGVRDFQSLNLALLSRRLWENIINSLTVYIRSLTLNASNNTKLIVGKNYCAKYNYFAIIVLQLVISLDIFKDFKSKELSISLWDLHELPGLPMMGYLYDEVIPSALELIGVDEKRERFIPRSSKYLLYAYHLL
ncbi:hypothetical protein Sango_2744900 [Sesamum angolense]|uniref:Reverse transcriptase n=1 Tax=Sesamum angolense TaxID=2727404 RepID=A0AAE1T942_9LAMI|nr:hypothetical protein Sango_2744900 [Sesamum angolense]